MMLRLGFKSGIIGYSPNPLPLICANWKRLCANESATNDTYDKSKKRKSFVKDFFLGKFHTDIFAWPKSSEVPRLERQLYPVGLYIHETVNSVHIDVKKEIPTKTLDDLKKFNLFGLRIPAHYGGLELDTKDYTVFRQLLSFERSIDEILFNHETLSVQAIIMSGNEHQKEKFLPKLAKGEWIAALAVLESDFAYDATMISTRATMSEDGQAWILSGKKKWVVNASLANIYIVLALTKTTDAKGKKKGIYTAFVVDKDFGGITIGEPSRKIGLNGVPVCEVTFEDTPVPLENVLGEVGTGLQLLNDILNSPRHYSGSSMAGVLRKLIKIGTDFGINRRISSEDQDEFKLTQRKLAEATCVAYAMESMSFMTAAIIDSQQYADHMLEATIVKIFSSENLWHTLHNFQEVFGLSSYTEEFPFERIFRDSYTVLMPDEILDNLKVWIALAGLQHAGIELQSRVEKLRNIFMYPSHALKNLYKRKEQKPDINDPTVSFKIESHVHNSLKECAKKLESCIHILQAVCEFLLSKYGAGIRKEELELMMLADIVICIYTMTAVLGRASYSLNNKLQNSDYEVAIVETICSAATKRVKSLEMVLQDGSLEIYKDTCSNIAAKLFIYKDYFISHPLDRNF